MDREILTAHSLGDTDETPLQMISAALLAHYRRCEAELAALKALMMAEPATRNPAG